MKEDFGILEFEQVLEKPDLRVRIIILINNE